MAFASLTPGQMAVLRSLRDLDPEVAGPIRQEVFAAVKMRCGIPQEHKLRVEIDDIYDRRYGTVVRKKDDAVYELDAAGRWLGATPAQTLPEWRHAWFEFSLDAGIDDMIEVSDFDDRIEFSDDAPTPLLSRVKVQGRTVSIASPVDDVLPRAYVWLSEADFR